MLIWESDSHTYRDSETGELLTARELTALRDAFALAQGARVDALADDFLAGTTDLEAWSRIFQELITHMMTTGYAFGRGGIDQMRDSDWEQLAYAIERQLDYAQQFKADLIRGDVSAEQLRARAKLYTGTSVRMAEEGKAAAHDNLVLPAYPGDTECKANCRCTWIIDDKGDAWECTWALEPGGNHCDDCLNNSNQWDPYVVRKGAA